MAKIWVVDDDLFYRKLISEALRENNHEVVAMHNGMNLIELLTESRPDLIVLDVFMAQKGGIDLLLDINQMMETRGEERIPVIVITGDDSADTELAVRKAKPSRFMLKPFSKEEIAEAVNYLLSTYERRSRRNEAG
ncbi:MAG: response regulator [Deltaproteobacteria bacterium]|nr:response regulator [Deltaproteobacteria bacterium]MBW1928326.1 response regulator [Deltaproteobacteria bacterium]RLB24259.1 MAG: hypothetical protein DRG76_02000 [Deltaproteobacteria bacterium]